MLKLLRNNFKDISFVSALTFLITLLELFYLNLLSAIFEIESGSIYLLNLFEFSAKEITLIILFAVSIRYLGLLYLQSVIVRLGDLKAKKIKKIGIERFLLKKKLFLDEGDFIFELSELVHLFVVQIFIPILRIMCDGLILILLFIYLMVLYPTIGAGLFALILIYWTIYSFYILRKMASLGEETNKAQAKYLECLSSLFVGNDEIFVGKKSKFFVQQMIKLTSNYNKPYFKGYFINILPKILLEVKILFLITLFSYLVISDDTFNSEISVVVVFLVLRVGAQLSNMANMLSNLRYGKDTIKRIEQLVGDQNE